MVRLPVLSTRGKTRMGSLANFDPTRKQKETAEMSGSMDDGNPVSPPETDPAKQKKPKTAAVALIEVPTTVAELRNVRQLKPQSLIDQAERAMLALWEEDPDFRPLMEAYENAKAVEGHTTADDLVAAQKAREKALALGLIELGNAKLWVAAGALKRAANRYGLNRKKRKEAILQIAAE